MQQRARLTSLLGLFACACAPADASTEAVLAYPTNHGDIDYSATNVNGFNYGHAPLVVTPPHLHFIFYGSWTAADRHILLRFARHLGGSPMMSVLSTYTDDSDHHVAHEIAGVDSCTDAGSLGPHVHTLDSTKIGTIVDNAIAGHHFVDSATDIYVVAADAHHGTATCQCGFHPHVGGHRIVYVDDPAWCAPNAFCSFRGTPAQAPNGSPDLDHMVTTFWHELAEDFTEPEAGGYRTVYQSGSTSEAEIADLCGRDFASDDGSHDPFGAAQLDPDYLTPAGGLANVHLGHHDYLVQPIWQNTDRGGCVRRLALNRPAASAATVVGDVDGNQIADLLWRDPDSGQVSVMLLDDHDHIVATHVLGTRALRWQIYGIADFDRDGSSDLLWRNLDTRQLRVWYLRHGHRHATANLTAVNAIPEDELVKAVGDFDGNGYADILFQNMTDNSTRVWLDSGTPSFVFATLPHTVPVPHLSTQIESIASGDFDDSPGSDVLWHDVVHNTYRYWSFAGLAVTSHDLALTDCTRVIGAVDVDADGTTDLVCVAPPDALGDPQVGWARMQNGTPSATVVLGPMPPEWRFSGGSTLGTHGRTGLLWRNRRTGALSRWLIDLGGSAVHIATIPVAMTPQFDLVSY